MSPQPTIIDELYPEAPGLPPVLLDRSTMENYVRCPFWGWAIETGKVDDNSPEADSGTEVHRVLGEGVCQYAADGIPPNHDKYMEIEIAKARPDVQPDAIEGLKRSVWSINRFLTRRHPNDLIAFQGGQGARSGQLAAELLPATKTRGPILATSEIDLLLAGATAVELHELDWKSGHTPYTSTIVKASFQFQLHAWLIFKNYPACEYVHTEAWMTRLNSRTPPVTFRRKDMDSFAARLLEAVEYRRQAMENIEIETWPGPDKCLICPAIGICPRAAKSAIDLNLDPLKYAQDTTVAEIWVAQRKGDLRKYVDEHDDIVGAKVAFGLRAPRKATKPKADQYRFYTPPEGGAEDAT